MIYNLCNRWRIAAALIWLGAIGPTIFAASEADNMESQVTLESITAKLETGQPLTFATFGDSITWPCFHSDFRQNYITLTVDALRKTYPKANVRIVHAGNLGTLGRGLDNQRFDNLVLDHDPDAVFIMFGMNDCGGGPGGVDTYDRNLTTTINRTKEHGALPIVLTQNEVIYPDSGGRFALPLYMKRAAEVAEREQVPFADCFALWQPLKEDQTRLAAYLNDAIHPNLAGHRLFAKAMLQALWPAAAEHVSDAPRLPMRPEDAQAANCLLPGPRGKQVVRTKDGTWFALWGRRRAGDRLSDLVVSFARVPEPTWDDFEHITLIAPQSNAVFDDQDRTLTAGMLLEADGRLWIVFSWNVGVFMVSLDLTDSGWPQRAGDMATWLGHSDQPYHRPTFVYGMNHDGNVLYDAYLTTDGWPAVFGRYFEMGPGAGWEVVTGEFGIGHVIRKPRQDPGHREFLFPHAQSLRCTQTSDGQVHYLVQQEAERKWQAGTLGSKELADLPDGATVCPLPSACANPQSFISQQPGDSDAAPLSWSDGERDGVKWHTAAKGFAYQSQLTSGDKTLGLLTCDNGEIHFNMVALVAE